MRAINQLGLYPSCLYKVVVYHEILILLLSIHLLNLCSQSFICALSKMFHGSIVFCMGNLFFFSIDNGINKFKLPSLPR
jgi:hypothetical protein